ncbi:putative ESAT-6-like protein 6 [Mycobacterium xenopi 4042]|uniref:Putative ESAT-6-like protein 6 n=2 Tax=Mycobacterium TaxID=1763 RepID=X8AGB9_MYCXE|nr:putative ESAT-6-like protein 6 [Mycobacterium xenopi 4042]
MTINYQFGDVDAHGATIRAQAAALEAEHQAIIRDVLAAGDFWGGAGSTACQQFITELGRNFQVIYEQANATAKRCKPPAATWPAPTAPSAPAGPNNQPQA